MKDSHLRFGHFAPYALPVDVFVDDERLLSGLGFGRISDPIAVERGSHRITVTSEGEPLFETEVAVDANHLMTVLGLGPMEWLVLPDDDRDLDLGRSLVRFVNLVEEDRAIDVAIADGATLVEGLTYGEASDFRPIKADPYVFEVRSSNGPRSITTLPEQVLDGRVHHTVVLHPRGGDGPLTTRTIREDAPPREPAKR